MEEEMAERRTRGLLTLYEWERWIEANTILCPTCGRSFLPHPGTGEVDHHCNVDV